MPSKISLLKYKTNYMGCLCNTCPDYQKSVVFGFIKQEHVTTVRNFLKYETIAKKVNDDLFMVSNNIKLKKPLNKKELYIKSHEPLETYLHLELNNIELKLIDDIKFEKEQSDGKMIDKLLLISNFKITNIEIDDCMRIESLNANIEGEYFSSLDYDD